MTSILNIVFIEVYSNQSKQNTTSKGKNRYFTLELRTGVLQNM